ncbi:MAG: methionine biosynthesis protein MetW [Brevinematia bacterium]
MKKLLSVLSERADLYVIASWIEEGKNILDLGCGDGELLEYLISKKNVTGTGVEIDKERMILCTRKGIPVIDHDLNNLFPFIDDQTFDYVILSQTLQQLKKPAEVIDEIVRISKYAILSFPNFGHYRIRLGLLLTGRMPKSRVLPYSWYDTPNIHLLTYYDFKEYCRSKNYKIVKTFFIKNNRLKKSLLFPNITSEACVVMIKAEGKKL